MDACKIFAPPRPGCASMLSACPASALAQQEPCIGNSAAITGPAAFGGQAIKMGAEIAIEEINAKGGVLGKPLRFVQYDDAGAPPRGVDNTRRIALADKCVGHPRRLSLDRVAWRRSSRCTRIGIPFVGVLAAEHARRSRTARSPNYMFRVSAKDKWVARFLVEQAAEGLEDRQDRVLLREYRLGQRRRCPTSRPRWPRPARNSSRPRPSTGTTRT